VAACFICDHHGRPLALNPCPLFNAHPHVPCTNATMMYPEVYASALEVAAS
jgi:hypothetical protein